MGYFKEDIKFGLFFNGEKLTEKAINEAIQDKIISNTAIMFKVFIVLLFK